MKNVYLDIISWPTEKEGNQDDLTSRSFEFYFQNQRVGKCSIRLLQNAWALCDEKQFFPDNWFFEQTEPFCFFGLQAPLKPVLDVTKFNFEDFQGQGFGRMGLQAMFRLSHRLGAEGRITLDAEKEKKSLRDPATFYEHCGFRGNEGIDGRKYFEPTTENIKTLFSKPTHPHFQMKEIPVKKCALIDPKTGKIRTPAVLQKMLEQQKS